MLLALTLVVHSGLMVPTPLLEAPSLPAASAAFVMGPLALLAANYVQQPPLGDIYVRPGVSDIQGVGLMCIRPVPKNGRICGCSAQLNGNTYLTSVRGNHLNMVHPAVGLAMLELFDGYYPRMGTFQVPLEYDEAIPLVSLINHSPQPNCYFDEDTNAIRAARPLRKGEEAVVDFMQCAATCDTLLPAALSPGPSPG